VDLFRLTREGADYVRRFLPLLSRFVRTLFAFPRPVVAAANGHAIAGGCIIVLAADARLMAEGAGRIGVPELLVGVPFPAAALEVVRFAVPRDKVQSLLYTGRTLPPQEALAAGLVEEVVAPGELLARAEEIARQLARIPPPVYRLTKLSLRAEALERIDRTSEPQDQAALARCGRRPRRTRTSASICVGRCASSCSRAAEPGDAAGRPCDGRFLVHPRRARVSWLLGWVVWRV
jgi:enoyl-CoA hydratase